MNSARVDMENNGIRQNLTHMPIEKSVRPSGDMFGVQDFKFWLHIS